MSKQCDIVRDILPLYVDGACSEASAEMVKEHLNACADCNAIYQKLLSHTSEDVLHEESESVIMRHEAKEKQRGRKKITIAVLVSIALCIIAIFTALFLLPINIAYEPVKIDFPFEVEDVESVEMYHYDGVPASAEKKVVVAGQKHHPKRQKQIPYGTYDVAIRILHHTLYTKDAVLLQRYKPGRNILIFCRGISCFHHCTIGGSVVLADTTLIGHSQGFQPGSKSRIEVLHGERKFHSAFIDAALHNQSRA